MQWFRMYAEFATDPVVQSMSFDDQRHFVIILCLKCSGSLDREFGDSQTRIAMLRRALGLEALAFDEAKNRLCASGLIDSSWQPKNWEKRQFVTDHSAAERMKRYRQRHRDVTVTSRVTKSDVLDTDTDTDTERRIRTPLPPAGEPVSGLDPRAWERFESYRRQIRKALKPASVLAAQKKLASFGADQAAVVEQTVANGWTGLFELKRIAPNGVKKAVSEWM